MSASKHTIYLTRNHQLDEKSNLSTNAFLFNENGPLIQAKWIQKNIEQNDGFFVVLDHNQIILREVEKNLLKRSYYIENINFEDDEYGISINPFDLVTNTSEIHFLFLNILYLMWNNEDSDLPAMSNLIDAFASCVFFMFQNQKEKLNMQTLRKMVYSVRATCQTNDGVVMLSDAIFSQIKDQDSMPCKYYEQFKRAAGDRKDEVAEKLAKVFDLFTDRDMKMMAVTDEDLANELDFKTAIFINVESDNEEHSANLLFLLLNYFVQNIENHQKAMFILDTLNPHRMMINLPYWMKESKEHNMSFLVCTDNLAGFKNENEAERFFKNLQKSTSAYLFMHRNENAQKEGLGQEINLSTNDLEEQDYVATILIPDEELSEQDNVF